MTLAEFKAWFEGFTESIEGALTEAQFARIKDRVREIDSKPITREVILERVREYWPYRRYAETPYWLQPYVTCSSSATGDEPRHTQNRVSYVAGATAQYAASINERSGDLGTVDLSQVMRDLGRAELESLGGGASG